MLHRARMPSLSITGVAWGSKLICQRMSEAPQPFQVLNVPLPGFRFN